MPYLRHIQLFTGQKIPDFTCWAKLSLEKWILLHVISFLETKCFLFLRNIDTLIDDALDGDSSFTFLFQKDRGVTMALSFLFWLSLRFVNQNGDRWHFQTDPTVASPSWSFKQPIGVVGGTTSPPPPHAEDVLYRLQTQTSGSNSGIF